MIFAPLTRPRQRSESIVPMINVVFLLLIFFLMNAQMAPPDPIKITPPTATGDVAEDSETVIHLGAEDEIFVNGELASDLPNTLSGDVLLKADINASATRLAMILRQAADRGAKDVRLLVGAAK